MFAPEMLFGGIFFGAVGEVEGWVALCLRELWFFDVLFLVVFCVALVALVAVVDTSVLADVFSVSCVVLCVSGCS